jgi:hypothetical protein
VAAGSHQQYHLLRCLLRIRRCTLYRSAGRPNIYFATAVAAAIAAGSTDQPVRGGPQRVSAAPRQPLTQTNP